MEAQNSEVVQIIEVKRNESMEVSDQGGNKTCGSAACDFSNLKSISKDAKERSTSMRKLLVVVALCIIFMSVEVIGGIKANSLAILTDAAHLLSDVAAFAISLFSLWASGWEATPRQSYGFFRIEILGALVSIQMIWVLAGILVYEAIDRIIHESGQVQGKLMFAVAAFGLMVNVIMAVMLGHDGHGHEHNWHDHEPGHNHSHIHNEHSHKPDEHEHSHVQNDQHTQSDNNHDSDKDHHHKHDTNHGHSQGINLPKHEHDPLLKYSEHTVVVNSVVPAKKKQRNINVHSAYLHVLGDSVQSIGVMIGGAIIWYKPEWKIIDLICTLIFSFIVLMTTIKMLRNILEVLMESTPREIDATRLEKGLCELNGVVAIHELHIWAITMGKVLLACHVTITPEADADLVLDEVIGYIRREYNISHVTIQIERQ